MNRLGRAFAIASVMVAADRIAKLYIQRNFTVLDLLPVIPRVLNIDHVENAGAAFGMLDGLHGSWRTAILAAISIVVSLGIVYIIRKPSSAGLPDTLLLQVALSCVLGGALGNLWDRALRGTVTDFIQVFIGSYEFPSFNVADIMINVGAGLLLIDLWRARKGDPGDASAR